MRPIPASSTTGTGGGSSVSSVSPVVLARLLLLIALAMVFSNLLFLAPLEDALPVSIEPHHYHHHHDNNNGHNSSRSVATATAAIGTAGGSPAGGFRQPSEYDVRFPKLSEAEGRKRILDLFAEAGVELTPRMESELPSWSRVQEVVGPHPYLQGLQNCAAYREKVPPLERMLGSAGMFNTGTNLVTHLLKQNCEIPERRRKAGAHQSKESYGMRWQVPWGKHTSAIFRDSHSTQKAIRINKEYILPVVMLRNPYTWFRSTCKNPYTAKWKHRKNDPSTCPGLRDPSTGEWNPVDVKYGGGEDHHTSLAHMWNDWYSYYLRNATYPWVAIRMEDIVFYPKETITAVCECAGGEIRKDQENFTYIVESAKADSPGHDVSTGIYAAWIKYSQPPEPQFGFSDTDYAAAVEALDAGLMEAFGYHHPPPRIG